MPLAMLKQGESGIICQLRGRDEVIKHLQDIGFVAGEVVKVVSEISGNLIIEIKGSRLAMDRVMVNRIILRSGKE